MKQFLPLALAALPAVTFSAQTQKAKKPNVIVIVADDQGYGGVNCYPHTTRISTPNIDRLAASGVKCMQGYTTGNVSSPTRAGLLTGKYQQSFGFYSLESPSAGGIPAEERMISQYLGDAGYKNACFGKWHVGDYLRNHPNNRGFDTFYGFINGLHDYFDPLVGGSWDGSYTGLAFMLDGMDPVTDMDYATWEFSKRAVNFIEQHAQEPFFVYLAYNAIHSPLQAPETMLAEYADDVDHIQRPDVIRAMTAALDDGVGKVTATLDRLGLRDNTIIFYLSDNGGVRGNSDMWELRGQKGNYFEGGIRVPFIVSYPGVIPAGQVYNQPVMSIDIAPTILSAASLPTGTMQGVNLIPYFQGEKKEAPHQVMYWSNPITSESTPGRNSFAIRQGKWKLVSDPRGEKECNLYDMDADPGEKNGLKEKYPEKYKELYSMYLQWIKSCRTDICLDGNARLSGKALMNKYRSNLREEGKPTPPMSFGVDKASSNGKHPAGKPAIQGDSGDEE